MWLMSHVRESSNMLYVVDVTCGQAEQHFTYIVSHPNFTILSHHCGHKRVFLLRSDCPVSILQLQLGSHLVQPPLGRGMLATPKFIGAHCSAPFGVQHLLLCSCPLGVQRTLCSNSQCVLVTIWWRPLEGGMLVPPENITPNQALSQLLELPCLFVCLFVCSFLDFFSSKFDCFPPLVFLPKREVIYIYIAMGGL